MYLIFKLTTFYVFLIIFKSIFSDIKEVETLNGESGIFFTKNFPEEYDSYSAIAWNITVAEGFRIKLTFHIFDVSILKKYQLL